MRRPSRLIVDRPRLFDQLDRWLPMTVVEAPRGFGKTVAVARWIERRVPDDVEVVWVSLESPVDSVDGLWRMVHRELTGEEWAGPGAEQAFVEHLEAHPQRRHLLVVDDAHTAAGAAWPVQATDKVIHHPNLHLVVITRVLAPITPWNVHEIELQWISVDDLAFTDDEVTALFDATGVALDDGGHRRDLRALADELGRWPFLVHRTAVQLAGDYEVRPEETTSPDRLARTLESLRAETAAYLRRDFLPGVLDPRQLAQAGRAASVLELTDETLALAVPDDDQRALFLEQVQQLGLVTMTSGIREMRYTFPSRIARALRERAALGGEDTRGLQRDVVALHRRNGDFESAWEQARALGDTALQAELVQASWLDVMTRDPEFFLQAISALPDELFAGHPGAWWVREALRSTGAAPPPGSPTPAELLGEGPLVSEVQALTALAAVIALRVRGEIPAGIELATRLVRLSDPSAQPEQPAFARLRGLVLTQAAFLHQLDGRARQAHSLWEAAQQALGALSSGVTTEMAAGALAQLAAERGDLREAETRLTEHRASPPQAGWLARRAEAPALIAQAWLALEQLRVDDAGGLLTDLVRRRHQDESWTAITQVEAAFELLWGDSAAMLESLGGVRTQRAELTTSGSYADVVLLAAAIDQHLCLSQATAAATLLERAPAHALIVVRRARLALVTGPPEGVLLHSLHGVESTTRERLELLLLHAAAHRRAGHEDLARELTLRCERLLARTRLTTPLSGLPRHDLEGLAQLAPQGQRLRELTGAGVPAPYPAWAEIVVLTEREGLVLDGLVEGLGVEALARRLFVSPNTVKTQVRSLYRKLGARSRGEALTRARILGLRA